MANLSALPITHQRQTTIARDEMRHSSSAERTTVSSYSMGASRSRPSVNQCVALT
jgi:hypothetical protein